MKQKGSIVSIVVIVLCVALIAGLGVYVYSRLSEGTPATSTVENVEKVGYRNEKGGYTLQIPKTWTVQEQNTDEEQYKQYFVTITSPSGTKVTVGTVNGGGRGGCIPQTDQEYVPHDAKNDCPTTEVLKREPLNQLSLGRRLELIRVRYTEAKQGNSQYILTVRDELFATEGAGEKQQYTYGGFTDTDTAGNYQFYVTPRGQNEDYFTEPDIAMAEEIFRSFVIENQNPFSETTPTIQQ